MLWNAQGRWQSELRRAADVVVEAAVWKDANVDDHPSTNMMVGASTTLASQGTTGGGGLLQNCTNLKGC